jgi:predicted RNA-binding Zn-ribbon protein involved in translation (DUF1610 family)
MKRPGTSWIVCLALVAVLAGLARATETKCPVCGTETGAARFTVTLKDGKEKIYACPRCAMLDVDVREARALSATDFLSRKTVDGRKAFYLAKTSYGECCPPFWLSFATREDAERFAKGFGGQVLGFDEALAKLGR